MAEYKCICCGEIKTSDKDCTCPTCGYKMFPTPYERHSVLECEIFSFLKKFPISSISISDFNYYKLVEIKNSNPEASDEERFEKVPKGKDDSRFPNFEKIQSYVCAAEKTERFCERASTSIEQLKKHIHTPFQQEYRVDTAVLLFTEKEREKYFAKAMEYLGVTTDFGEISLDKISLDYCETPNEELLVYSDELFDLLLDLSNKIKLFIKQNNIYGSTHREKIKSKFKYDAKSTDSKEEINKCIESVKKVLNKKYMVDIFSDGSDELKEMLKALWNSIYVCMNLPLLNKVWRFSFASGESLMEFDFCKKVESILYGRYERYFTEIESENILSNKSEGELFEHLNQMIDLDVFGFFNVDKFNLMQPGKSEKELNKLIGLSSVKNSIQKIKAYALANRDTENLNINMCFYGNPGTGKTEVARLIAGILHENKIIPSNKVIEVDRSGLVSQYFGATAEKTSQVIRSAMGGVLFVDEAYALGNNSDFGITDYGKEAIDTLVKAMEDYRGKMCFIFAGYRNQMKNMIEINPGFKSRIQFELDFGNYSREELGEIAAIMISGKGYSINDKAMSRILDITDIRRKDANFANAREIRNIIEQVIMCQNIRNAGVDDKEIAIVDVNKYIDDSKIKLPTSAENSTALLTGEDELNNLIGLETIKRTVKKIKAYAKRNKAADDFNLHMSFAGNPGTGKTEVARIISRILYDAGVLSEAKVIETNAQGLLGKYVGETGPKTQKLIGDAMGGVLFIDEAYGLISSKNSNGSANYGDEAVSVLLKSMEDHRGQFCVIFAGYKKEMTYLLDSNPGLLSRIQFSLDFPDYTCDELKEIALLFLAKRHYEIEEDALSYVLDIAEYYRREPNFANARTIRNILDQVIMNQNLRVEDENDNNIIIYSDVNDYVVDEKIDITSAKGSGRIGF